MLKNGCDKKKKRQKIEAVRENEKVLQKYYNILRQYYKNISKIFQIVLTILLKCNIYNTKKTQNKWRNYLGNR